MRRWIIMLAALLAFAMLPSQGTDLSELIPAAVLVLRMQDKQIALETDTGDKGTGETLEAALRDLQDSASGKVLLDTVENLILAEDGRFLLPELRQLLRPGVRVCTTEDVLDPAEAWRYLHVHVPEQKLSEMTEKTKLPVLTWKEERFHLENGN